MPKVSGNSLISETTEKIVRRSLMLSAATILVKAYDVPLNDLHVLGMDLPQALVDTALLAFIAFTMYSHVLNWTGDLAAFRLWYQESSIWSQLGTHMKLDSGFIRGGIPLLQRLHQMQKDRAWPETFQGLPDALRKEYEDFKTNIELYTARLAAAGKKFSLLSAFGHYYVWVHSFVIPLALNGAAIYLLIKYGTFTPPAKV